jgi:arsenate reductase
VDRETVLFVCRHNSARSQMAEGLLRARYGDHYEAFSAGTEPSHVHPLAAEAMREVGVDLSGHRSEHVDGYRGRRLDAFRRVRNEIAGWLDATFSPA